jgi:hypothetical protein
MSACIKFVKDLGSLVCLKAGGRVATRSSTWIVQICFFSKMVKIVDLLIFKQGNECGVYCVGVTSVQSFVIFRKVFPE